MLSSYNENLLNLEIKRILKYFSNLQSYAQDTDSCKSRRMQNESGFIQGCEVQWGNHMNNIIGGYFKNFKEDRIKR